MEYNNTKLSEIKEHWTKAAQNPIDDDGLRPTARDPYLQSIVETAIERRLYPDAKLLDIGCGDGLSTFRFAKVTGQAIGIDYVEDYVRMSRENAAKFNVEKVSFEVGNVLSLSPILKKYGTFDVAVSIRCLINLPSWDYQASGIEQIASCIRPGGLYFASEGWIEGFNGLNLIRARAGLSPTSAAKYNCLITRLKFEEEAMKYFEIMEYVNLGLYLYLSRVVQPVYTRPDAPFHTHKLNHIAAELVKSGATDAAAFESCDYSGVYVLRRKT